MDVEIDGLRFERDRRVVLDIPSLRLRGNRTTVVLGPNGAGKTTLLRLIAALERPQHGCIRVGGAVVPARSLLRQVAFVFQEHVFLRLSVRENLDLALKLRSVDTSARAERIADAARLAGITHLLDRRADRLSGGEGRRASLARALCLRAPLVLLDEPLAGLDPATYVRLLDELPQLLHVFGSTTVLVTHDHREALRLAEDLVVMIDGQVCAAGAKQDVVLNPRTTKVAEALGYVVLTAGGRRLGIGADALKPGPGSVQFELLVEELLDLVDHREIIGSIQDVRVHLTVPLTTVLPDRGRQMAVHVDRACELT
jgi:tungstate transport system ATP-binding protein